MRGLLGLAIAGGVLFLVSRAVAAAADAAPRPNELPGVIPGVIPDDPPLPRPTRDAEGRWTCPAGYMLVAGTMDPPQSVCLPLSPTGQPAYRL